MLKNLFIGLIIFILTACNNAVPKLQPLPPNAVVLAYGDSLTYGTGAPSEFSYPAVLAKITNLNVINAGKPGETTGESLERLNAALAENHPQLVILCLGGNDMLRHTDPAIIKTNLRALITAVKNSGAQLLLIGVPQAGLSIKAPSFYSDLAADFNVPIDMTTLAKLEADPQYKSDQIHLNQQGYWLLAQSIADLLTETGAIKK